MCEEVVGGKDCAESCARQITASGQVECEDSAVKTANRRLKQFGKAAEVTATRQVK